MADADMKMQCVAAVQGELNLKEPWEALSVSESDFVCDCGEDKVAVQWKYSPIHPSSINILQGKYVFKPELPYVGGAEGCGVVLSVGSSVSDFSEGDVVVRKYAADKKIPGCWQTYQLIPASALLKVPNDIDQAQASMSQLNPLTAWGLLDPLWHGKDLQPGDWIIQNASNSAVGQCIIQIAKVLGFKTFNLVRREELIEELKALGADEVVLDNDECLALAKAKGKMKVAINAVGGDSAKRISKCLQPRGVMVTYGAMSRQPVVVSNSALIFFLMSYIGFHLDGYIQKAVAEKGESALEEAASKILAMIAEGKLKQTIDSTYEIGEAKQAIERAFQGGVRKGKVLFKS